MTVIYATMWTSSGRRIRHGYHGIFSSSAVADFQAKLTECVWLVPGTEIPE